MIVFDTIIIILFLKIGFKKKDDNCVCVCGTPNSYSILDFQETYRMCTNVLLLQLPLLG